VLLPKAAAPPGLRWTRNTNHKSRHTGTGDFTMPKISGAGLLLIIVILFLLFGSRRR